MSEPILKSVNELLENKQFFIPHYQRGFRWTQQQVNDLLNDLDDFEPVTINGSSEKTFYCLQPIVVKECDDNFKKDNKLYGTWYEVVDGQQRLTTIALIIHYANEMWIGKKKVSEPVIKYETREGSTKFLKDLKVEDRTEDIIINKSNLDFYYMSIAYRTIHHWVNNYKNIHNDTLNNNDFQSKLRFSSKVIWYEVESHVNSIDLFTRLNLGKIPLTNSELIKALFLSSSSFRIETNDDAIRKKIEIAQIWDEIEKKLNELDFWSFITNSRQEEYPTKIEMLFDMIAEKLTDTIDPYYTFLYFLRKSKEEVKNNENIADVKYPKEPLWELWLSIEKYYLTLCEWYKDKNLYHKIGYLVAIGGSLEKLIKESLESKKIDFDIYLDDKILESVNFDIDSLSYDKNKSDNKIEKILLLFNVESIRSNKTVTEYYPFEFYKKTNWSIEHIHAQNSELIDRTKKDQWITWLDCHYSLLNDLINDNQIPEEKKITLKQLKDEISSLNTKTMSFDNFKVVADKVIQDFSEKNGTLEYEMHHISNLALLSLSDNALLNNSVFEVKRREIIKMDKEGNYLPLCTKRVFFKYYNDNSTAQQYYFWGKDDRDNYLKEIKNVIGTYCPQE